MDQKDLIEYKKFDFLQARETFIRQLYTYANNLDLVKSNETNLLINLKRMLIKCMIKKINIIQKNVGETKVIFINKQSYLLRIFFLKLNIEDRDNMYYYKLVINIWFENESTNWIINISYFQMMF